MCMSLCHCSHCFDYRNIISSDNQTKCMHKTLSLIWCWVCEWQYKIIQYNIGVWTFLPGVVAWRVASGWLKLPNSDDGGTERCGCTLDGPTSSFNPGSIFIFARMSCILHWSVQEVSLALEIKRSKWYCVRSLRF